MKRVWEQYVIYREIDQELYTFLLEADSTIKHRVGEYEYAINYISDDRAYVERKAI